MTPSLLAKDRRRIFVCERISWFLNFSDQCVMAILIGALSSTVGVVDVKRLGDYQRVCSNWES